MAHSIVCHFLIGLPASGKSTLAQILAQESCGLVVSTDQVRAHLYGDEAIQGVWQEIETEVLSQVKGAINQRQSVIYDATNANCLWRTGFYDRWLLLVILAGLVGIWFCRSMITMPNLASNPSTNLRISTLSSNLLSLSLSQKQKNDCYSCSRTIDHVTPLTNSLRRYKNLTVFVIEYLYQKAL
jgi:adenylate kinase family enzyme